MGRFTINIFYLREEELFINSGLSLCLCVCCEQCRQDVNAVTLTRR